MDPFDDPPIEVIRVHLQASDMLHTALYAGFFVLTLVVAARDPDERGPFVALAAAFLGLSILWLVVSPLSGLLAATAALDTAYRRLAAEGTLREHLADLTSFDGFTEIVGLDDVRALDARYET